MSAGSAVKVGRPRALTRHRIVETAVRIGLNRLTMKRLAAELGVTIPTIYQYVTDREEITGLAVDLTMAQTLLPPDTGQHWSDYARQATDALSAAIASSPSVIPHLLQMDVGQETEVLLAERVLQTLTQRGLSLDEARKLMECMAVASYGSAVLKRRDAIRSQNGKALNRAMQAMERLVSESSPSLARRSRYFDRTRPRASHFIEPLIKEIESGRLAAAQSSSK